MKIGGLIVMKCLPQLNNSKDHEKLRPSKI